MTSKDIFKITINLVIIYVVGGLLLAGVYALTSPVIFQKNKQEKEAALSKMMPLHLIANVPDAAGAKVAELVKQYAPDAAVLDGKLDIELDLSTSTLKKFVKKLKRAGAADITERSAYSVKKAGDWEPWHKHAEHFSVLEGEQEVAYIVETYGKGYSSYINVLVAVDRDFVVQKINVLHHAETPGLGDEIELDWFKDMYRGKDVEHLVVIKGETEDKIQAITGATISTRAVTDGVRDGVEMLMEKYSGEGAAADPSGQDAPAKQKGAH